jgi:hypothetical protein
MLSSNTPLLTREDKRKAYSVNKNSTARAGGAFIDPVDLALWVRDTRDHACAYCGEAADHIDHIVPLSKGGRHCISNLQRLCKYCNVGKSDQLEDVFFARVARISRRRFSARLMQFFSSLLPKFTRDYTAEEKVLDVYGIPAELCGRLSHETRKQMFDNALRLVQTINQRPTT